MTQTPAPLSRRKLPIGIQTFREVREDGCYYVDKTGMAVELVQTGKAYFLSRPRRFGKSLFLDTLKELFEGRRALFEGLAAEPLWDWGTTYPVIRLSLSDGVLRSRAELDQRIGEILIDNQRRLGLHCTHQSLGGQLAELIALAHQSTGQRAVVLVDEYDKPILDNITDSAVALEMREGLRNLYSVLKGADEHLKFVFLTGVSKFSKVSLFSGLNNLTDLTLEARYSALCGYTEEDVDQVFAPELPGLDREQIRQWYNGYNWLGQSVYNPFDVLLLFRSREFRPYWFETGTPTFLVKLLQQRRQFTPDLGRIVAPETLLSTFDVDHIPPEALLFQAGYLTIDRVRRLPSGNHEFDRLCNELGIEHRLTKPRTPKTNGMVERFNGRISDVLKTNRFNSSMDLEQTLLRYVTLYNHQLPQSALKSKTPIQVMKQWYDSHPHLFLKRPYNRPGCNI